MKCVGLCIYKSERVICKKCFYWEKCITSTTNNNTYCTKEHWAVGHHIVSVSRAHHGEVAQTGSMRAQVVELGLTILTTSQAIGCVCERDLVLAVLTHLPLLTCVLSKSFFWLRGSTSTTQLRGQSMLYWRSRSEALIVCFPVDSLSLDSDYHEVLSQYYNRLHEWTI